jgi:hypothetical protein
MSLRIPNNYDFVTYFSRQSLKVGNRQTGMASAGIESRANQLRKQRNE